MFDFLNPFDKIFLCIFGLFLPFICGLMFMFSDWVFETDKNQQQVKKRKQFLLTNPNGEFSPLVRYQFYWLLILADIIIINVSLRYLVIENIYCGYFLIFCCIILPLLFTIRGIRTIQRKKQRRQEKFFVDLKR